MKKFIFILPVLLLSKLAWSYCSADFSFSLGLQSNSVIFNNLSISDGEVIQYYWDFGDGNVSSQVNPEHVYQHPGRYQVYLTVLTPASCVNIKQREVVVGIQSYNEFCSIPLLVQSNNATQPDYNNGWLWVTPEDVSSVYSIQWSNGSVNPCISNLEPGSYCATVTDAGGCYASNCYTIGYNNNCLASFIIDSASYHHITGCYRFVNNSHGEVSSLRWDFGDGSISHQLNPIHVYQQPGDYEVCLYLESFYGCFDTICRTLMIPEAIPFLDISGTVYAGDYLLPDGMALLFQQSNNRYNAISATPVHNGSFWFSQLDIRNKYIVQVIPHFDVNTVYYPKYLPGYLSDSLYWQHSRLVSFPGDTAVVINLPSNDSVYFGNGNINGYVYYQENSSYEQGIYHTPWFDDSGEIAESRASNTVVLLLNGQRRFIDFCLTRNDGAYAFENLRNGTYFLRVEKAGLISQELRVDINEQNSHIRVADFIILISTIQTEANNYLYMTEVSLYPNPVDNELIVENAAYSHITVCRSDGTALKSFLSDATSFKIDMSPWPEGIYFLIVEFQQAIIVKKIIKI